MLYARCEGIFGGRCDLLLKSPCFAKSPSPASPPCLSAGRACTGTRSGRSEQQQQKKRSEQPFRLISSPERHSVNYRAADRAIAARRVLFHVHGFSPPLFRCFSTVIQIGMVALAGKTVGSGGILFRDCRSFRSSSPFRNVLGLGWAVLGRSEFGIEP